MVYDARKILPGLVLFVLVLAWPAIYTAALGTGRDRPVLEMVTAEKQCLESTDFMRRQHMTLLKNDWRETVVRKGARDYAAADGKVYPMSLTKTCLGCHPNKANFCDRCHNYVAVKPACWNCHIVPEEVR